MDSRPQEADDIMPDSKELQEMEELIRAAYIDLEALAGSLDAGDPVRMYLKEIGKFNPLPAGEEAELLMRVAEGDRGAKRRIAEANLRVVVGIAKRYAGGGMNLLDLIQEGNLGLIRAIEEYEIQKGYKFTPFAVWWIKRAIEQAANGRETFSPK